MGLTIKRVKHFMVEAEDKPGALSKFTKAVRDGEVNLLGLWGFGVGQGKAQVFCVPEEEEKFIKTCQKAGYTLKEGVSYAVSGDDRPGALCDLLDKVANAKINLHAVDAVTTGSQFGAYLWVEAKEADHLGKILGV